MIYREPGLSFVIWLFYLMGAGAILLQPRYGIYLVVCLGLAGDAILSPWFPFVKNFSSRESILFINDAIIVNPLELYLALIFLSWFIRVVSQRKVQAYRGELFRPAMIFLGFVFLGFAYGIYTGGNLNIALWEVRPLIYLIIMLILTSNLLEKREHVVAVVWSAMLGIFLEGVLGNLYVWLNLRGNVAGVNAITDHPAAVHMNTLIVFFLAVWLYKVSPAKRVILMFMVPVVLVTYIATQRRAAFVTLAIALIIITFLLFKENRTAFWVIVPIAGFIGLSYLLVFWNQSGPLGLPAQAIKSIIAPGKLNAADQASNAYRDIENFNLHFTIRNKPLTGVGFGQKFYVVIPLPDISFFQWWQYFPHNSIIWIWLKTGIGGFFSMLYLVGLSIMLGARALWRMPRNELSAVVLTALLYIIMHFIFAYVDMGWDSQSMVYIGVMMGVINRLEFIVSQPVSVPKKRWRWQPDPQPLPELLPLMENTPAA
ncbi:MAG: hypothetical protein P8074_26450 [Anaerolineales bacterium]